MITKEQKKKEPAFDRLFLFLAHFYQKDLAGLVIARNH
jgi:hypothetical protein